MPSIDTGNTILPPMRAGGQPLRLALSATALLALSACANLHTIHRTTDLPDDGKAVHLDAAQRVIHVTKDGKACAEPTPDALQSYASAFGSTLNAGADGASFSNALRANAASVGLHSQSITLMRQHLFNICEYAQNDWLNDADVMLLMERSQDLTLGILAIEQLTGAVVARQALLEDNTDATAAARQRLLASQDALATQARLDLAIKKEQALQANAAAQIKPATLAAGDKEAVILKTAQESTSSDSATDRKTGKAQASADAALAQARTERAELEAQLADQLAQSQSGASGRSGMTTPLHASNVNDKTAAHLARASTEIVNMILNKGHLTDMCITFINHPKKYMEMWEHYQEVMNQCKDVLTADLRPGTTHPYSTTIDIGKGGPASLPDSEDWSIVMPRKSKPKGNAEPSSTGKPAGE
ncbi:hypothetical protein O0882_13580 [Janthinobacterium sp. SUN073]|uniref:hypothetical protein n=1 Tax=Janthinobacterium sp. SUN073 TaxID=3004102 RepID=UPI0025B22410|nr:hypothetical protein [Janthinobacterium sp. SUN073]MDN2697348.1 hypothetical protein [Janthinobacterium sp. SUN073]